MLTCGRVPATLKHMLYVDGKYFIQYRPVPPVEAFKYIHLLKHS